MCGENLFSAASGWPPAGSPPRVRGKLALQHVEDPVEGITPACAGKTAACDGCARTHGDHPRVCGENPGKPLAGIEPAGSPPRVRGKHAALLAAHLDCRITPACAGKTPAPPLHARRPRDHPRVCGENRIRAQFVPAWPGSPPRVRGKHPDNISAAKKFRITPACAGKTSVNFVTTSVNWDHPRVCGENTSEMAYFRG